MFSYNRAYIWNWPSTREYISERLIQVRHNSHDDDHEQNGEKMRICKEGKENGPQIQHAEHRIILLATVQVAWNG